MANIAKIADQGLTALPETISLLKKARRKAMRKVHPDLGGTDEDAAKINRAYDDLGSLPIVSIMDGPSQSIPHRLRA